MQLLRAAGAGKHSAAEAYGLCERHGLFAAAPHLLAGLASVLGVVPGKPTAAGASAAPAEETPAAVPVEGALERPGRPKQPQQEAKGLHASGEAEDLDDQLHVADEELTAAAELAAAEAELAAVEAAEAAEAARAAAAAEAAAEAAKSAAAEATNVEAEVEATVVAEAEAVAAEAEAVARRRAAGERLVGGFRELLCAGEGPPSSAAESAAVGLDSWLLPANGVGGERFHPAHPVLSHLLSCWFAAHAAAVGEPPPAPQPTAESHAFGAVHPPAAGRVLALDVGQTAALLSSLLPPHCGRGAPCWKPQGVLLSEAEALLAGYDTDSSAGLCPLSLMFRTFSLMCCT